MNVQEIYDKLSKLSTPPKNYLMFRVDPDDCLFGKSSSGDCVFMIKSNSPKIPSVCQETKSLKFIYNKPCVLEYEGRTVTNTMHVLVCKNHEVDKIKAFIRLTKSFSFSDIGLEQYYLVKLFSSISSLFDKTRSVSEQEVQGLFSELYTIIYLHDLGCDISKYWQSRNKMKFDFSLNSKKRIEIKSTLKPQRIHHFRHDQLLSELYDIKIISILLRKNDQGLSLENVVEKIRELYPDDFTLMLHIETTLTQIDDDYYKHLKYDEPYLQNKLLFFDANDIPHFNEKSPEGVFNAEYDCDLENSKHLEISDFIQWVQEEDYV